MFTQLKLAGILDRIRGFVFGTCAECGPGEGFASLTLEEIFADHIKPLGRSGVVRRDDRSPDAAVDAAGRRRGRRSTRRPARSRMLAPAVE